MSKAHKARQAAKRQAASLSDIAPAESQAPRGKASGRHSAPYRENAAMLDNILFGTPLPDTISAKPAANDLKAFNDDIAAQAAAKMTRSPLIAICHKHSCSACGHKWASFQFYARKVSQDVPGQAQAFFTKRVEDKAEFERVSETHWVEVTEPHCIQCYQGEKSKVSNFDLDTPTNPELEKLIVPADWSWRKHTPLTGGYAAPEEIAPGKPADFTDCHVTETVALKGRYPTVNGTVCEPGEAS